MLVVSTKLAIEPGLARDRGLVQGETAFGDPAEAGIATAALGPSCARV
jgi:hypothetical protein